MTDPASDANAHFKRGMEKASGRQYQAAHRDFQRAVEVGPDHAEAWSELGWLTYGLDLGLGEASQCLEQAIRLDPMLGMAHLYYGVVSHRQSENERAEAHFCMALGLVEQPGLAHAVYAEEFLWRNSRYGEAEEHFRAALDLDPDLVLALRDYARMLVCHGRDAESKEMFSRALRVDPWGTEPEQFLHAYASSIPTQDPPPPVKAWKNCSGSVLLFRNLRSRPPIHGAWT